MAYDGIQASQMVDYFKIVGSPEDCVHMQSKSVSYITELPRLENTFEIIKPNLCTVTLICSLFCLLPLKRRQSRNDWIWIFPSHWMYGYGSSVAVQCCLTQCDMDCITYRVPLGRLSQSEVAIIILNRIFSFSHMALKEHRIGFITVKRERPSINFYILNYNWILIQNRGRK